MNARPDAKEAVRIDDRAKEIAYKLIVANMPYSFIESPSKNGEPKMTRRAIRLRNAIAEAILRAARLGVKAFDNAKESK